MELRWGLLLIGFAVVASVYFYSRYRQKLDMRFSTTAERKDPVINELEEGAAADAEPDASERGVREQAVSEPEVHEAGVVESAESPLADSDDSGAERPSIDDAKIVAIRLMARTDGGFPADKLILALREEGLRHGSYGIFHRLDEEDESRSDFSVASLVEPGSFDLTRVKKDYYPGVSIFLMLPGSGNAIGVFDDMLTTSRALAQKLDGELLDEEGSTLSIQRERYLREEIIQFEHQIK